MFSFVLADSIRRKTAKHFHKIIILIWGCQTLTKCHCKITNINTSSGPFDLGLSNVDKMSSLQDKEHQYKLWSF